MEKKIHTSGPVDRKPLEKDRFEKELLERDLLEDISYCEKRLSRATIGADDIAKYSDMKEQYLEKLIINKHPNAITYLEGRKEFRTRIPGGKKLSARTRKELLEKLYNYYYGKQTYTVGELYPLWRDWTAEMKHLSMKTLKVNDYTFDGFIRDSKLAAMKIRSVRGSDIASFMTSFSETVTRSQLGNIKTILNGIFDYAVAHDITEINYARQYNTRMIKTKAGTDHQFDVYTDADREKILSVTEESSDLYDLAIAFAFCVCCRIGEIRALHYEDIDFEKRQVIIRREIVYRLNEDRRTGHYIEVPHTKTGRDSGIRVLPLTERAIKVLERAIQAGDGEKQTDGYIFRSASGKPIYERMFAKRLKEACAKTGVKYRSSHKIRFWAATALGTDPEMDLNALMASGGWACEIPLREILPRGRRQMDMRACPLGSWLRENKQTALHYLQYSDTTEKKKAAWERHFN